MAQAMMTGARLSYVVVPQEGTVRRTVHQFKKGGVGIITKSVEEPAGYLVYFPRGHVIRVKDKAMLRHYKLDKEPQIINLQGLYDRNSAVGKLMTAQDDAARRNAMVSLEQQVIKLAEAHSGRIELVRDQADLETEDA
jgi:hypothetical protein